jgi:hypothetical protein
MLNIWPKADAAISRLKVGTKLASATLQRR